MIPGFRSKLLVFRVWDMFWGYVGKFLDWYCWWKKSCTSWYVVYPIIYKVYISDFLLSITIFSTIWDNMFTFVSIQECPNPRFATPPVHLVPIGQFADEPCSGLQEESGGSQRLGCVFCWFPWAPGCLGYLCKRDYTAQLYGNYTKLSTWVVSCSFVPGSIHSHYFHMVINPIP